MLTPEQREQLQVVLVSPRNPLNIGAVARAMANFGFSRLAVAAPYTPHWREARSAVGAPELLTGAEEHTTLAESIARCTLVLGTGTQTHRKPEQAVVSLPALGPMVERELQNGGNVALVLGPEKHGLTREDLSYCHVLVEIPTDAHQPSMNLGQAAAVCLYELACGTARIAPAEQAQRESIADSASLERLASVIEEAMLVAHYSPASMHAANQHDLRLLLRRMSLTPFDVRRILGLFRRILHRLSPDQRESRSKQ